jgi:hypothetical protein
LVVSRVLVVFKERLGLVMMVSRVVAGVVVLVAGGPLSPEEWWPLG